MGDNTISNTCRADERRNSRHAHPPRFEHFRDATQDAIDAKRTKELIELFQMADRVLANAFPAMRSLFHVVYVEHLLFDDRTYDRSWALEVLTLD